MNSWTIRARVTLGLCIILFISYALFIYVYFSVYRLQALTKEVETDLLPAISLMTEMQSKTLQNKFIVFALAGTINEDDYQNYEKQYQENRDVATKDLSTYQEKYVGDDDRPYYQAIVDKRASYLQVVPDFMALAKAGKSKEANELYKDKLEPAVNSYLDAIKASYGFYKKRLDETNSEYEGAFEMTHQLLLWGVLISLVTSIGIGFLLVRNFSKALSGVSDSLSHGTNDILAATTQIASASQSLADGANKQAASMEETGAALEEIGSMTKKNTEYAKTGQKLASETRQAAEAGADRTREMNKAIEVINAASMEMASAIQDIKTSSNNVSKIISTIDEIAFQTNILALNAAVEAARAGEAGMGFAVVANEVRNLAQRSANAAKETAAMIEASVMQSNRGVEVNAKVNGCISEIIQKSKALEESLDLILTKAKSTDEVVNTITEASREQYQGLEQVNGSMGQINHIIQTNAAGAQEIASSIMELKSQSNELLTIVATLDRLNSGTSKHLPPRVEGSEYREENSIPEFKAPIISKVNPMSGRNGNGSHGPVFSKNSQVNEADWVDFSETKRF